MKSKAEMNSILSIFSNSTIDALQKQFMLKADTISPLDHKDMELISAFIEIDCNKFKGQIRIHFEKEGLIKLYNEVFDEELTEMDDSNSDFAGEVMNILYCLAKEDLSDERGFYLDPAIPKSINNPTIFSHSNKHFFKFEDSIFFLELFENNWATQVAG